MTKNILDANLNYLFHSGLIDGALVGGRATPIATIITAAGITLVETPTNASQYSINVQILQVDTMAK